jgi:hypothetical protein
MGEHGMAGQGICAATRNQNILGFEQEPRLYCGDPGDKGKSTYFEISRGPDSCAVLLVCTDN